jgi:hypothetical protein
MHLFILPLKQARLLKPGAWWWIAFLLVWGRAIIALAGNNGDIDRITAHQVKNLLGRPDTVIIDVRTQRNWWRSSKKIPTAVREDPARVDRWRDKYLKDQTLIFYCS